MKKEVAKKRALFVIESDPEHSPRPAEAVRIAAGLGAWKDIRADLLLTGHATKALGAYPEELVDGHIFRDYLPTLNEQGGMVMTMNGASALKEAIAPNLAIKPIEKRKLAETVQAYDFLFHF